jgi:hypothetical protein
MTKFIRPARSWDDDEKQRLTAELEREIIGHIQQCIDNLMALANGVEVEASGDESGRKVYQRPPDRAANEYILNRIFGRPAARKPLDESGRQEAERIDLSRIPQDRLDLMEKWLAEADVDCQEVKDE